MRFSDIISIQGSYMNSYMILVYIIIEATGVIPFSAISAEQMAKLKILIRYIDNLGLQLALVNRGR